MYETIDLLQQTTDYYYIDYIPYNTDDPNFLELEEYFEKHYLSSFSEKITKIILKIIYYYPCKVYLTEPTKDIPINSTLDFNSNIRHYSPSEFSKIIKQVILTDFSSLQILFSTPKFLISICGDFSVIIYGIKGNNEAINLLQQLTTQEGLFLKQNNPS